MLTGSAFATTIGSLDPAMKTDQIQTDITDITFVFIFLPGFGFEYSYFYPDSDSNTDSVNHAG
jgi:hypothetical protein